MRRCRQPWGCVGVMAKENEKWESGETGRVFSDRFFLFLVLSFSDGLQG